MSIRLHQGRWPAAALSARLADSDAVVLTASLLVPEHDRDALCAPLNAAERARFEGYSNEIVARRFAVGRGLVRAMLAEVLGTTPRDVPLREGLHGKPFLAAGTPRALWFSVSHTDDLLVVALSRRSDVGVDAERSRAFEQWQRVAERVLSPAERRQLAGAVEQGDDPSEAFLRHWCRVEAELKAIGCGIAGLEAHLAGASPRGLRVADLTALPLPADVAATGIRYQAALALCAPGAESVRQSNPVTLHDIIPVTAPTRASTA